VTLSKFLFQLFLLIKLFFLKEKFGYHLVETPPLSEPCSDFLQRVSRNEIIGYTSTVAIAEATHKVMLAEVVAKFHLEHRGLAHRLQRRSEFISQLSEHKKVVPCILPMSHFRVAQDSILVWTHEARFWPT
jgi:predicted nucleic acid-binding protein